MYIYIERERSVYVCIHIYIYTHTHVYIIQLLGYLFMCLYTYVHALPSVRLPDPLLWSPAARSFCIHSIMCRLHSSSMIIDVTTTSTTTTTSSTTTTTFTTTTTTLCVLCRSRRKTHNKQVIPRSVSPTPSLVSCRYSRCSQLL